MFYVLCIIKGIQFSVFKFLISLNGGKVVAVPFRSLILKSVIFVKRAMPEGIGPLKALP